MAGTPLRVSDELVAEAKVVGDLMDRSATSQLEHWARLGRAVEAILGMSEVLRLKQFGTGVSLEEALSEARTPGARKRALAHLESTRKPRYGADPKNPELLVRIEPDGRMTRGRFIGRKFVADDDSVPR